MPLADPKFTNKHWLRTRGNVTEILAEYFGRTALETSAGIECVDLLCEFARDVYLQGRADEAVEQVAFRLQDSAALRTRLAQSLLLRNEEE